MSFYITIDTSDYDNKMSNLQSVLKRMPREIIEQGSAVIENDLQRNVPVRTGRLRNSITREVFDTSAVIRTNSGYGRFVNDGTAPHIIYPRNARFLRFEIQGKVIYAKRVRHPGFIGRKFVELTLSESMPKIMELLKNIWNGAK